MSKKDILSGASIALLVASLVQTKASAQIGEVSTPEDCWQSGEQETKSDSTALNAIAELPISEESTPDFEVSIPLNALDKAEKKASNLSSLEEIAEFPPIEKNLSKPKVSVLSGIVKQKDETDATLSGERESFDRLYSLPEFSAIAAEEPPLIIESELLNSQSVRESDRFEEEVRENESDLETETIPDAIAPMGREIASQWGAIEREMLPSFWYEDTTISLDPSTPKIEKRAFFPNPTDRADKETRGKALKAHLKTKRAKELPGSFREIPHAQRSARREFMENGVFPLESLWHAAVATIGQTPVIEAEDAIAVGDLCAIASPAIASKPLTIGNLTISGLTAFSEERIRHIVNQALRELGISPSDRLSPEQQEVIAHNITRLYLESGYLTSRASVEGDTLAIFEGELAEISVRGRKHLNADYICDRLLLGVDVPFNVGKLEEQLRLMRESPLFANIEASLEAAGLSQRSRLIVNVKEAKKFYGTFGVDNYSPAAVGSERMGFTLGDRNLTGRGDLLQATYSRSTTGGADVLDLSYQVPLNAREGTLQLRFAPNWTEITQPPFDQLDINGRRRFYGINYRQPLIRNLRQEFALSLGFNRQEGQTFIFDRPLISFEGVEEDGSSRTSTITFAQDYLHRDRQGVTAIGSQFNFGTGLLGVTTNESPTPDGLFFSWSGQLQRVQKLGGDRLLLAQLNLQLTPDTLLPAHQFIIGGGQSVRGYRQNARGGDNGIRLLVEGRLPVTRNVAGEPEIQLAPFFNAGKVWNHPDNPNQLSDRKFLAGVGMGILWEGFGGIENLKMRLDYGVPLVYLADRGKNVQDNGFYFQMQVEF